MRISFFLLFGISKILQHVVEGIKNTLTKNGTVSKEELLVSLDFLENHDLACHFTLFLYMLFRYN